ncbi:MAG: sensor domain-containing diguanylate cyclase, partial [Atopostipes suicloacalis]|nr:sensor domain-containing diguanylate cyclase [Atopostipes suicloacalis]
RKVKALYSILHKIMDLTTKDYDNREIFKQMLKEDNKIEDLEINYIRKDGSQRVGLTNIVPLTINNEKHLLSSIIDISERIKYEKKLLEMSNRDSLTNLYNRRYLLREIEDKIDQYRIKNTLFSIAILDIDDFKEINDEYGHLAGDFVLVEFSKILSENLADDTIIGRFGGEEFLLVMSDKDKLSSQNLLRKLLKNVKNQSFKYNGREINLSFSAGVSSAEELEKRNTSSDCLIGLADKRMYSGKNNGKGKIIYREK